MIDLRSDEPAHLATFASAQELVQASRALEAWDDTTAGNADLILVVLATRACARKGDREEIGAVQRAITNLTSQARAAATLPPEYRARWLGFADILEARRLQLAAAAPDALLSRRHVPEILQLAIETHGGLKQSEISERLGAKVSPGRISQLLTLMESHGLIERTRTGRDNLVKAPESARNVAPQPPKSRGAQFLSLQQAA
ncbi:MAG: MarR family transcriptional regulator [Zoogloeaceae bacterium]|nr:MarR family transcriptional regulator [Zoogloeaceae bacterium]